MLLRAARLVRAAAAPRAAAASPHALRAALRTAAAGSPQQQPPPPPLSSIVRESGIASVTSATERDAAAAALADAVASDDAVSLAGLGDVASLAEAVAFLCHPALRNRHAGAAAGLFARAAERNGDLLSAAKKSRKYSRASVAAILESAVAAERACASDGLAALRRCLPAVATALDAGVPLPASSIADAVALCMRVSARHPADDRRHHVAAVKDASQHVLHAARSFRGASPVTVPVPADIASADRVFRPLLHDWFALQAEGRLDVGGKPLPQEVAAKLLKGGTLDCGYLREVVLAIGPKRAVARHEITKLIAYICGLGAGGERDAHCRPADTRLDHAVEAYGLLLELGGQPRPRDALCVLFAAFAASVQSAPGTTAFSQADQAARYVVNDVMVKYRSDKVGARYKALVEAWFSVPSSGGNETAVQGKDAPPGERKEGRGQGRERGRDRGRDRGRARSLRIELVRHGASGDADLLIDTFRGIMATAQETGSPPAWVNDAVAVTLAQLLRIASASGEQGEPEARRLVERADFVVAEMGRCGAEWNDGVFSILTKIYTRQSSDGGAMSRLIERGRALGLSLRRSAAVDVQLWALRVAEASLLSSAAASSAAAAAAVATPDSPWVAPVDNMLAVFDGILKPAVANTQESPSTALPQSTLMRMLDVCTQRCQRGPADGADAVRRGGFAVLEALAAQEGGIGNACATCIERWFAATRAEAWHVVRGAQVQSFGSAAGDAQCTACGTVLRAHSLCRAQHEALLGDVNQVFPAAHLDPSIAESQAAGGRVGVVIDGANVGWSLPGKPGFRADAITQFLRQLNGGDARARFGAKHASGHAGGGVGGGGAVRALVILPHHYAPPDAIRLQWARWGHSVFVPSGRHMDYDDHAWFCASLRLLDPGRHAVYCATNDNMSDLAEVLVSEGNQQALREWRRAHQILYSWDPSGKLILSMPWDDHNDARSYFGVGGSSVAEPVSNAGGPSAQSSRSFHFPLSAGGWLCSTSSSAH